MPGPTRKIARPPSSPAVRSVRRRLPVAEKLRLVELTLREGVSIRSVAREHGINRHSLYQWRAQYAAGELAGAPTSARLLPVRVSPPESLSPATLMQSGRVEIGFRSGVTMRIDSPAIDSAMILALVSQLK